MKKIDKGKISIIIPVYNIQDYLDNTLDSVVCQTYKNIEIILVNDGSSDESNNICEFWKEKDERIKYIEQENKGVSIARNVGFSNSSGEYILFIDGDDEIAQDMCEQLLTRLIEDEADASYCGFFNIFKDKIDKVVPRNKILVGNEIIYALVTELSFFTAVWNKLFKREHLLDTNGNFIEFTQGIYIGEDALWLSKVLKNIKRMSAVPSALYFWKRRENSVTQGGTTVRTDEKYLSMLYAYREIVFQINEKTAQRIMCKKYLGCSRDCMIQAYIEKKWDLKDILTKRICKDKKLYGNIDFFILKLNICVILVKLNAPLFIIKKVCKIK